MAMYLRPGEIKSQKPVLPSCFEIDPEGAYRPYSRTYSLLWELQSWTLSCKMHTIAVSKFLVDLALYIIDVVITQVL